MIHTAAPDLTYCTSSRCRDRSSLGEVYEHMAFRVTVGDLIERNYLCKVSCVTLGMRSALPVESACAWSLPQGNE